LDTATRPEAAPAPQVGRRLDVGRIAGVPIMVCLLLANLGSVVTSFWGAGAWDAVRVASVVGGVLTVCFCALATSAFLRRSTAKATYPSWRAAVVAVTASWLPLTIPLLPRGEAALLQLLVANALLIAGTCLSIWSIAYLDRSFSLIAQARSVVRGGPYAYVRHPLYTGELTAFLGMMLLGTGWPGLCVWLGAVGLQVYRASREEIVLAETLPDYRDYQRTTPQLVPWGRLRRLESERVGA
jgi:protein-S-isoprenylcysteine O-methyltransferase Ste14